jgi:hypothetical protein
VDAARLQGGAGMPLPFSNIELSHFSTMGMMAMALGLIVLTLVAGCLQWTLHFHFEEFYPLAKDRVSHARRTALLFRTFTGLTTVGVVALLRIEFHLLVTS